MCFYEQSSFEKESFANIIKLNKDKKVKLYKKCFNPNYLTN